MPNFLEFIDYYMEDEGGCCPNDKRYDFTKA